MKHSNYRLWPAAVVLIALWAPTTTYTASAADMTPEQRQIALDERAKELIPWVVARTGYSDRYLRYETFIRPASVVNSIFYGADYKGQSGVLAATVGTTVFMPDTYEPGPFWDPVLVHELTHVLQYHNGAEFPCVGAREKEAYEAEAAYIDETGSDPINKADEFFMMLLDCRAGFHGPPY